MRQTWIIAKRELQSFFDSLVATIVMVLLLGITGYFTWVGPFNVFLNKTVDLQPFFTICYWALPVFVAALTIRQLAEERRTGTIELLLTKGISDRQVVYGKFLATMILVLIALAITAIFPLSLAKLGNLDEAGVIAGYLALALMSAAYIASGLFASSITRNQVEALLVTLLLITLPHFLIGVIGVGATGFTASVFDSLDLMEHFDTLTTGVIDSRDVVYFITLTLFGLMMAEMAIRNQRLASKSNIGSANTKGLLSRPNLTLTGVLLILNVMVVNLLAEEFYFRIDLTEDKQHTLSDATVNVLESLEETVTVKAYFSDNLPTELERGHKKFEELLADYARKADGNFVYSFINPMESEELELEAQKEGVQKQIITVPEEDQVKQQFAFFSAVVELGEGREVIPIIQPQAPLEYQLTTAIKKMAMLEKQTIGFLQGHGEPELRLMRQAAGMLSITYNVEPINLTGQSAVPDHLAALAIVRPKDSIPQATLNLIDQYLANGGKVLVAYNEAQGDFQSMMVAQEPSGLGNWLLGKGVEVESSLVIDANCGVVPIQRQTQFGMLSQQIAFPYFPIIALFEDHPASKGLEGIMMPFASPMNYLGDTSVVSYTPLAATSDLSASVPAPGMIDVSKQWAEADFPDRQLVVAAALEGPIVGDSTRMVVIADGDFCVADQQQLHPDNVNLLVNSIDWLADDTGLIELRTRGVLYRPIDQLDDSERLTVKYLNFLLPILLVVLYSIARAQVRKRRRNFREALDYGDVAPKTIQPTED